MKSVKALSIFALASTAMIGATAWVASLVFRGPGEARAVHVSALVALVVQLVAFGVARVLARRDVWLGWGVGALMRFGVLAVYAMVVVKAFAIPSGPALVTMAACFFLSTLIEPLLLTP